MTRMNKLSVFFRGLFLQTGLNFLRFQAAGFAFVMLPRLKKMYEKEELNYVLSKYVESFNTNPFMASYAFGALQAYEERIKTHAVQRKDWMVVRSSLTSTLASVGDRLFFGALKPFAFAFAAVAAVAANPELFNMAGPKTVNLPWLGPVVYFVMFNIPVLIERWRGMERGYTGRSSNYFGLLKTDWNKLIRIVKRLGLLFSFLLVMGLLYGQVSNIGLEEEFLFWSGAIVCFVSLGFLADKLNIPNVYVYLASTLVFLSIMMIF